MTARERAEDFIRNEKQFHLGFLPTEQSNPKSATLEADFRRNSADGVRTLQNVDRDVLVMAKRVFASERYAELERAMLSVLRAGGRIVFSGCGATGRLSILLESMWRTACRDLGERFPAMRRYADRVFSIMTGGDFALVKSVEFFEDYACFGRRQVRELDFSDRDLLVAITEGGETSSVLGTVSEAADRGGRVFLLFNNPADLLAERLERSRNAIRDPRVCVLDLSCGPMALAGSTRMQATTSEQLIAGGALESVFCALAGIPRHDYAAEFGVLLDLLEKEETRRVIADYIDFEEDVYAKGGRITYFAHDFMLDLFTDTTERSPTFMLPPFRGASDRTGARSWAFVKDPLASTPKTWQWNMARPLRCLAWTMDDYRAMGVADRIAAPPKIAEADLLDFKIGNEPAPDRSEHPEDAAVVFAFGAEGGGRVFRSACAEAASAFRTVRTLAPAGKNGDFALPGLRETPAETAPLRLMDHLEVKQLLNTISTGVMTKNGRVSGNWMSYVALSNKKLIDRGIRLVAELGGLSYEEAAVRVFSAMEETAELPPGAERISAVQYALKKTGR